MTSLPKKNPRTKLPAGTELAGPSSNGKNRERMGQKIQRTPEQELALIEALETATDDELFQALRERQIEVKDTLTSLRIGIDDILGEASENQLCEALNGKNVESDYLIERLGIEPEDAFDLDWLYDLVAEDRKREALDLLYEWLGSSVVHPTTQLRLVELRGTA